MKVLLSGASGNLGEQIRKSCDFDVTPIHRDDWSDTSKFQGGCLHSLSL